MISSKQDFRNYIRSMLGGGSPGEGVINIEVSNESMNNAIDKAVKEAERYLAGEGIYEDYFVMNLSAGVSAYSMSGADVAGVIDFELSNPGVGSINQLFSPLNMMYGASWSSLFTNTGPGMSLANYQSIMIYLEAIKDFFTISYKIDFNELSQVFTIQPTPTENSVGLLRLWRKEQAVNLYNNVLVQELAIAWVKHIWGMILSKQTMLFPDGSSVKEFGQMIWQEGKEEKKYLIERMNAGVNGEGEWTGFLIG